MSETKGANKSDLLRRRPASIRYFYMAVGGTTIHTGASYGGLQYVQKNHGIEQLFLADVVTGETREVSEPADFMALWKDNYNDPSWSYFGLLDAATKAAARRR